MSERLKVYGVRGFRREAPGPHRQTREIVAARSWAEARRCFEASGLLMTMYELRTYGGITANEREIAIATAEPGVVFWRGNNEWNGEYRRTPSTGE